MADRWRMVEDREAGLTHREIAKKHGVSIQYVSFVVGKYDPRYFKYVTEKGCVYPNLRRWLNENKISAAELLRRMYLDPAHGNIERLRNVMRGRSSPRKDYIDRLIEATGMKYEKLFKEEKHHGK